MAGDDDENGGNEKIMYSDKINVNILTSLMVAHGVTTVVICPGSRNAPLAHNFASCPDMYCVAATDERSAGFYALGLALGSEHPVAVCVTSGSALLNLAPAVAEAYYREVPLLVISADRPLAMINQLQGQTLPQVGALGAMVKASVQLPEPHDDLERWHCNRMVNDALLTLRSHGCGPVHVNVPISEPLYNFTTESLPVERKICLTPMVADPVRLAALAADFASATKPMLVLGQMSRSQWRKAAEAVALLKQKVVVLAEKLSDDTDEPLPSLDLLANRAKLHGDLFPDFIIYIGGNLVAKNMRQWLQQAKPRRSVVVTSTGAVTDVLMNATDMVEAQPHEMLQALTASRSHSVSKSWLHQWQTLQSEVVAEVQVSAHDRQNEAIRLFFQAIKGMSVNVHVANSLSVRMALKYADRYLFVNRGVNGIEGSLSTAAGHSVMSPCPVACIIGDLSFFYDANALWNEQLCGNFRVLLLNNQRGEIFSKFKPLANSPACDTYVMAKHHATAEGVCLQNRVEYRQVKPADDLAAGIQWLVEERCPRPMLLEVML